jgi:hypothetical protein
LQALTVEARMISWRGFGWRGIVVALVLLGCVTGATAAPSGPPIRIGGTLALTGPLAPTALLHKLAGEIYVEELNKGNGLLGRPVEWLLLDDQSKPDLTRSLYEKLITVDKVDLLMGPYATSAILAAMGVAQRYQKMLPHHSYGMPHLAKYEMHFPTAAFGPEPNVTVPARIYDALATTSTPPKSIAIVTSKFPSAQFQSNGAREVAEKRGLKVALYLEYEFGTRDFGAIAARIKDAKPDFLWVGALGLAAVLSLVPGAGAAGRRPRRQAGAVAHVLRGAPADAEQRRRRPAGAALPRPRRQGWRAVRQRRHPGRRLVRRLAGPGSSRHRDQGPRRQGHGAVVEEEPGGHHHGSAALRRAQQLRRRPLEAQAGAGRQVGGGVAAGVRRPGCATAPALIGGGVSLASACRA